jgi:nicotinamidase-related amidase
MQALICVDMQNDFCLPGAPLYVACAGDCLPYCQAAIEAARSHGIPVIWVIREHDSQGTILQSALFMSNLPAAE